LLTRVLLALTLLAACGDRYTPYATEPRELTLDSPGKEPRRLIAYPLTSERRDTTMTLAVGAADGDEMISALAMTASVRWSGGARDGNRATYELHIDRVTPRRDPTMGDEEWSSVRKIYEAFEDVSVRARVTAAGAVDLQQTRGKHTTPDWTGLLHMAIVPLPTEPVGPGARWRTRQSLGKEGDTSSVEERTYELDAIDGDRLVLRVSEQITYTTSAVAANNAHAVPLETRTSGTLTVQLSSVLPAAVKLESRLKIGLVGDVVESAGLTRFAIE
jgi:hypothetical protein